MARAFALDDYVDASLPGVVLANGSGLIQFGPVDPSKVWRVSRVMVAAIGSALDGECFLYVGDVLPQNLRDGTTTGNLDIGEYPAPLVIPATEVLSLQWLNMTPGAQLLAGIQYTQLVEFAVASNTALVGGLGSA